jgi:hypothetical protein
MSQVIDTKVVEMQFDNSKFEKNIETSLNSLRFLNKNIEDAGRNRNSLDELARAGDQVGISFDNMNMKSKISLNMMDLLAGVGTKAFNKITDAVSNFALNMAHSLSGMQAMRDGFNEYELKMGSVQTILAGAKIIDPKSGKELKDQSARLEVVNQKLEALNAYSDRTIYSFKDMTSNIGKFTNAGVNLSDAVDAIQGVANVAAVSGANASEASRAMYNFAQALSSGYVKLIDWKSIENANMATVDFKEQLLKTALALGTVRKEGDMYVTTTTNAQGKVSEAFNATKMFNDSLAHQWMTTEVLTTTLKKYTDESTELGRKAFAAATEVKTFSQMMDTLKESLGSGWAQTFEIIFGNFEEAKQLWTGLNNVIDGMLSPIGKVRNEILELWKILGGREAILQGFKNLYNAIKGMLAPLKEVWEAFTPTKGHTAKYLISISKYFERFTGWLLEISPKVAKVLRTILSPVVALGKYISKLLPKVFGILKTIFKAVLTVVGGIVKILEKGFGVVAMVMNIVNKLRVSLLKAFNSLKDQIKNSAPFMKLIEAFKTLKNNISELFERTIRTAGLHAREFADYLKRLWAAIEPLVSSTITKVLTTLADFLLPRLRNVLTWVIDKIKSFANVLSKIDIKNTKLYKGLAKLPELIKGIAENKTIKSVVSSIKGFGSEAIEFLSEKFKLLKANLEAISMPKGLSEVFSNITNFIKNVFGKNSIDDGTTDLMSKAAEAANGLAIDNSGEEMTAFQKFLEGVSKAFEWLKQAASDAKDAIKTFIDFIKRNTPKALHAMHDFLAGDDGVLNIQDVTDFLYSISESLATTFTGFGINNLGKAATGFSDAFGDIAESVTVLLKRTSNKFRMSALKDFAIAIGILAGALFLLSRVNPSDLMAAATAIIGVSWALKYFFDSLSSGSMEPWKVAGNLSIGAVLLSIAAAMVALSLSVGVLVGALAIFPRVIESYNNLGDKFRAGMDRVKEVLAEIFEYLDHTVNAKYGLKSALALIGLVAALNMMRKTIVKFASKETGEAMADGLERIKEVLDILGGFLASTSLASLNFINVGIDFDTLGMAAMILALSVLLKAIKGPIESFAKLSPSEYKMAFNALDTIFFEIGAFMAFLGFWFSSYGAGVNLGKMLGMAAVITLTASAVGSIVQSVGTLVRLSTSDPKGLGVALGSIGGIFVALGGVLYVIGKMQPPQGVTGILFGLMLTIGAMTACLVILTPIAHSDPLGLATAVIALGVLMIALGESLSLIKNTGDKVGAADIFKVIAVVLATLLLTNAIRRLSKANKAINIVAAGAAIAGALASIGFAIKLMDDVTINWGVIAALGAVAAIVWGVVFAIRAFKGTAGGMAEGAKAVEEGSEKMNAATGAMTEHMAAAAMDVVPQLFDGLGAKIKEAFQGFNLGEFLREKITELKADVKNWAQDFLDIAHNLIEGIATAIGNPDNVARFKEVMKQLGKAILDAFKAFFGIHSPSTVMEEQGGFILDGLLNGLMEYPKKLVGWVAGIGKFIADGVGGFFSSVAEKGKTLAEGIGNGIQNGKAFVSEKVSALGKAVLKKVDQAEEWGQKATKAAKIYGLKLQNSKNPVKRAAGSMILGAVRTVTGMSKTFGEYASIATTKFASEIRKGTKPSKAAAIAMLTAAKAAFANIKSSFLTFGQNAAEGFRNGINKMISKVAEKAREMVRRAKNAAKDEEDAHSPSRVFMEYGSWAAQGYAIGMTNRKSTRFIEQHARAMIDTARDAIPKSPFGFGSLYLDSNPALGSLAFAMAQISDTVGSDIESNPTIRPVIDMSNVNQNASAISALFGDKSLQASLNATGQIQSDFERVMANQNGESSIRAIDKLTKRIDSMTETMNSRSLNVYNTIDGTANPEAFANDLIRSFTLNARTV